MQQDYVQSMISLLSGEPYAGRSGSAGPLVQRSPLRGLGPETCSSAGPGVLITPIGSSVPTKSNSKHGVAMHRIDHPGFGDENSCT